MPVLALPPVSNPRLSVPRLFVPRVFVPCVFVPAPFVLGAAVPQGDALAPSAVPNNKFIRFRNEPASPGVWLPEVAAFAKAALAGTSSALFADAVFAGAVRARHPEGTAVDGAWWWAAFGGAITRLTKQVESQTAWPVFRDLFP